MHNCQHTEELRVQGLKDALQTRKFQFWIVNFIGKQKYTTWNGLFEA